MLDPFGLDARLLEQIYEAASDLSHWPAVLTAVADWIGGLGSAAFCSVSPGPADCDGALQFAFAGRLDEAGIQAYAQSPHLRNPWSLHMDGQREGVVVASEAALPLSQLAKTAFYGDILRPLGIAHNAMAALVRRGNLLMAVNICRTARQGPFDEPELGKIRRLVPHLQRAFLLGYRMEAHRSQERVRYEALDHLAAAVLLLGRDGTVLFANRAARALLQKGSIVRQRDGLLGAAQPQDRTRLAALLRQALQTGVPGCMTASADADGPGASVIASPLSGPELERFAALGIAGPRAIVVISRPAAQAGVDALRLRQACGLTPTEADIALAAASGETIADIARRVGQSPNTVKTHLKQVFAKTGIHRRAELAQVVGAFGLLVGHGIDRSPAHGSSATSRSPAAR